MDLADNRQERVPYEYIKEKFSLANPQQMADMSFSEYRNGHIYMSFMGRLCTVSHPDAVIKDEDDEEITSYTLKTLFLRFLVNSKGIEPSNEDITYKDVQGALAYYPNFEKRTISRLAKIYGNDLDRFKGDMSYIRSAAVRSGDAAFKFPFMNRTFMTFIVWKNDEEFPAGASILFDKSIQFYFNAEDLAVVPDIALDIIKNKGVISKSLGLYQE